MSHEHGDHAPLPYVGLAIAALLALLATLGPALLRTDPLAQDLEAAFTPPGAQWWLGADHLGRSVLARLVAGAPLSLGVAAAASIATAAIGTAAGLAAAGWPRIGRVILAFADLAFAVPALLIVLLAAGLFGGGIPTILAALAIARWPAFARACHPLARAALAQPDAEASRLLGFGPAYRLRRHAWPAIRPVIASMTALGVGANILAVSALGFIGIGLAPPRPEWGAMVADSLPYLHETPAALLAPAAALVLATLAATLIGEAWSQRLRPGQRP